jgi:hypothetical protein
MAGLGRKTFNSGDVLNAADVQGYLMDQAVMVFAGTAARGSAIPTPSAGMVAYSTATQLQVYNGSAWVDLSTGYGAATGGTSSSITVGGVAYTLLTFTSSGTLTVTKAGLFDVYAFAGGGGGSPGGFGPGAGGGAGGAALSTVYFDDNESVVIGAGGGQAVVGTGSYVGGVYSVGGGTNITGYKGLNGGSGSGSGNGAGAGSIGLGYPTQGNDGGAHVSGGSGGGGGAGSVGVTGTTNNGGAGGTGVEVNTFIGGSSLFKSGGGGGGGQTTGGAGGSGIGGAGNTGAGAGGAAGANTASGGGGGGPTPGNGGNCGSGIIYVRFKV